MTGGVASGPPVHVRFAATLPKSGGVDAECEDRIAFGWTGECFRAAVADGASASLMAGEWADLLASGYREHGNDVVGDAFLKDLGARWHAAARGKLLPWHAAAKRGRGAHATLLGITFSAYGHWDALSVGDCCLFQVRADTLLTAFPVAHACDFSDLPALISTEAVPNAAQVRPLSGEWRAGDDFFLLSDALAEWFLREGESGARPHRWIVALRAAANAPTLASWAAELRELGRLRDDDIAVLHLRLGDAASPVADA